MKKLLFTLCIASFNLFANPYPDPTQVPVDPPYRNKTYLLKKLSAIELREKGVEVIRVDVQWSSPQETYTISRIVLENSGTEALEKRSKLKPTLGSYIGELRSNKTALPLYYDSVGTGMELRFLTRGMTFRFPKISEQVDFVLTAENPKTGRMEEVLRQTIDPHNITPITPETVEVRELKKATVSPSIMVNIYSEGYSSSNELGSAAFFKDAQRVVDALESNHFPGFDRFEMVAAYKISNTQLGKAKNLGMPIPIRDSYLGLYYPYWNDISRWYNIVYPTSEKKFRDGVGVIPYDYAIALVDSSEYWGMGNYNVFTAIPTRHPSFTYLLTHEFGHFFGLNEEYEGGGKTELAFAPEILEPWSQNITFHPKKEELKWIEFVEPSTALPTPAMAWQANGPWGAYRGGYAQTEPLRKSHKPGLSCIMKNGTKFCPICKAAIEKKILYDVGLN